MTSAKHPSLKAMAEGKVDGIQKATYFKVDPHLVEFEPGFNLREERPALTTYREQLYQAMKAGAAIPPIDVSVIDGKIIVREGHCRTLVAQRLVEEGFPYVLEARHYRGNATEAVLHMLGSGQKMEYTPLEQGQGFLRLVKAGMTAVQIAESTGLHRNTVDNWLVLAEAPAELQGMVSREEVAAMVAVDMVRKHGDKAVEFLKKTVEKVKSEGGTKVTKQHVAGPKIPPKVAQAFLTASIQVFKEVDAEKLASLADNKTVPIKASTLRALLTAHSQCVIPSNPEDDEL